MSRTLCITFLVLLLVSLASAQSCSSSADCPTQHSCDGDTAVHVSRRCVDGFCEDSGATREDCLDRWYCDGRNLTFVDGYCLGGFCVEDAPVVQQVCNDVRYCVGSLAVVEDVHCSSGSRSCEFDGGMPWMTDCAEYGLICSGGSCVQATTTTLPEPIPVPESTAAVLVVLLTAPAFTYLLLKKK